MRCIMRTCLSLALSLLLCVSCPNQRAAAAMHVSTQERKNPVCVQLLQNADSVHSGSSIMQIRMTRQWLICC